MAHLYFGGQRWDVTRSEAARPGATLYAASQARIDASGRLVLRLARDRNGWCSSRVETEAPLGYGDYVFDIECAVRELPADVALTFGTFRNDDSALLVRFTRHGWDSAKSGEFLVPGVDGGTARFRFAVPVDAMQTRHVIAWRPHQVTFSSFRRWGGILGDQIAQWAYRGDQVPAALTERVRVALTTDRGARAEACESRLERFSFRRYSPITIRRGGTV